MGFGEREKFFAALSPLTYKIEIRWDFYLWVSKKTEMFLRLFPPHFVDRDPAGFLPMNFGIYDTKKEPSFH